MTRDLLWALRWLRHNPLFTAATTAILALGMVYALLDTVLAGAVAHLNPGGRLLFTIFGFLGPKKALAKAEGAGLTPSIVGRETQSFPRLGYERLEWLRTIDDEGALPSGPPATVERLAIEARLL